MDSGPHETGFPGSEATDLSYHADFADVRLIAPIRPVEIASVGIEDDGARFSQVGADEDLPVLAVQFGDFDRVRPFVAPIQIPPDPIHR